MAAASGVTISGRGSGWSADAGGAAPSAADPDATGRADTSAAIAAAPATAPVAAATHGQRRRGAVNGAVWGGKDGVGGVTNVAARGGDGTVASGSTSASGSVATITGGASSTACPRDGICSSPRNLRAALASPCRRCTIGVSASTISSPLP